MDGFLTSTKLVTILTEKPTLQPSMLEIPSRAKPLSQEQEVANQSVLFMTYVGANQNPRIVESDSQSGISNYFLGNNPTKWVTHVPHFSAVTFQDVYPGIDVVYHGDSQGGLKYDFLVHPGANANQIQLRFEGATSLILSPDGALIAQTPAGVLQQGSPVSYQQTPSGATPVSNRYVLESANTIGFALGPTNPNEALVIDPLVYSTYVGGSLNDEAFGMALDGSGNAYITGSTSSTNFPTTSGSYQTTTGGSLDVFVTKLNPTGTALVYSTYIGGSGADGADGIAVDNSGNAYITGGTSSPNYPTTSGAFQATFGGGSADAFVTKLNPTGTALVYSTYLGGAVNDVGTAIALDGSGSAYVTGYTTSPNYPITNGAFQTTLSGPQNAFVTKLNPTGTALIYSTYLGGGAGNPTSYTGGSAQDAGLGIVVDGSGDAFVAGYTGSTNFPTTNGAYQTTYGGGPTDAFVTKLNPAGTALIYSTYIGGANFDYANAITLDASGDAFITGETGSWFTNNYPTTPGAYQSDISNYAVIVTKLNPTGTGLLYSTYLHGNSIGELDFGQAIAVDAAGSAYVTGYTSSVTFPTTQNALQRSTGSNFDGFVTKFNATGTGLLYSSYIGGNGVDAPQAIALDGSGNTYIAGFTTSTNYPTTPGSYQTTNRGTYDAFVSKIGIPTSTTASATMRIQQRPSCYTGTPLQDPATSYCSPEPPGFTDSIGTSAGNSTFLINWGDFNGHEFVTGCGPCTFWLQLDLKVIGSAVNYTAFNGKDSVVATLERFNPTTSAWVVVPDGSVHGTINATRATIDLPSQLLLTASDLDTHSGSALFRLVPQRLPGSTTTNWQITLYAAEAQLVAPPVVLVHGWDSTTDPSVFTNPGSFSIPWEGELQDPNGATSLHGLAKTATGQDPWAWDAPNGDSGEGIHGYTYDFKQDVGVTTVDLYNQIRAAQTTSPLAYNGPIDLVAHSLGGLIARLLLEYTAPLSCCDSNTLVRTLVTLGTPSLGSEWADTYTVYTDLTNQQSHFFAPSDHYYWAKSDHRDLGNYPFGFSNLWTGWRPWWGPVVEPIQRTGFDGSTMDNSVAADFEIKKDGNPFLDFLNRHPGAPGVTYDMVAGNEQGANLIVQGDGIVSTKSATLNYATGPGLCFDVVNIPFHGGNLFKGDIPGDAHTTLPAAPAIKTATLGFLEGTGQCQAVPSASQQSSVLQKLIGIFRNGIIIAAATPGAASAAPAAESVTFSWNVTQASHAMFLLEGNLTDLNHLSFVLTAPNGDWSNGTAGTLAAQWDGVRGAFVPYRAIEVEAPMNGTWAVTVSGTPVSPIMMGEVKLNTTATFDDLTSHKVLLGRPVTLRVHLADGGAVLTGAQVRATIKDNPSRDTTVMLHDSGNGNYTATYTPRSHQDIPYTITARRNGLERVVQGELAVLATPNEAQPTCTAVLANRPANSTLHDSPGFDARCGASDASHVPGAKCGLQLLGELRVGKLVKCLERLV